MNVCQLNIQSPEKNTFVVLDPFLRPGTKSREQPARGCTGGRPRHFRLEPVGSGLRPDHVRDLRPHHLHLPRRIPRRSINHP